MFICVKKRMVPVIMIILLINDVIIVIKISVIKAFLIMCIVIKR